MPGIMSAAGLVGFLSEPDPELQVFALRAANDNMSLMWTELAAAVGQVEALYEDDKFPERELAALVAAKIYYQLQEYDESMVFALGAGKLFDIESGGEFEDTIIARCIDTYVAVTSQRHVPSHEANGHLPELETTFSNSANGSASTAPGMASPTTPFSQSTLPSRSLLSREDSSAVDGNMPNGAAVHGDQPGAARLSTGTQKSLQAVIRRIFERCFQEGAYRQVVGIAVEAKNLDVLRETITRANQDADKAAKTKAKTQPGRGEELMDYLLDICMNIVQERGLRNEILQLILDLLATDSVANPDFFAIARCIVYLNQHTKASDMLQALVEKQDSRSLAIAYQISFDLYDNGTQEFLANVLDGLPQTGKKEEVDFPASEGRSSTGAPSATAEPTTDSVNGEAIAPTSTVVSRTKELTDDQRKAYTSIREILTGAKSLELNVEFLFRANKADPTVLSKLKSSLEARNSIFHSAVTFANAFTNSGTANDSFIRENLDWLAKAVNWSKFSVTASMGVIHKGNIIGQGKKALQPYLTESAAGTSSSYSRAGALYGLGFIYANHGHHVQDYLFEQLKKTTEDEIVQHGACLGLGMAAMGSGNEIVAEELKNSLWAESAISGQAAGLGMGLVLLGTGNVGALKDMLQQAQDTDHDKTVRGLAVGMALVMYARQEAADELINGLLDDPDPIIRYGGIMTIAMAYCGTSSNKAIRKLLHVAVSDVNDDVRRMAVMSLGFVLFRKPNSVPRMVELLAESYNPHVRYGATMALGIACAGTGLEEAVDLLEPMMKDSTDFVRQGTLIALSMIMMQQSEAMNPKVVTIRKHLLKVVSDRHEDAMAKFGASLALGIIDAGGRNCTIGLQTQTGNLNMSAIVGMAVFTQYWYWFPFTHFLSLAFTPTSVIGVDQDLDVPQLKLSCAARPSMFEYPPSMEVKQEEAPEKVKTAVLSTTAQAKRRKIQKEKASKSDGTAMDVDAAPSTPKVSAADEAEKMETDEDAKDKEGSGDEDKKDENGDPVPKTIKQRLEKEKVGFEIDNMSRVLPAQLKYTSFPQGRYAPVKKPTGGVVLLTDTTPSEPKTLIERQVKKPAPPQPRTAAAAGAGAAPQTPIQPRQQNDAAAVLNAVDEDEEGVPEAEVPGEFDYLTDGEGGGSDD